MLLRSQVPDDAKILKGRLVLATKEERTENKIWKARFVVKGYCHAMKVTFIHDIYEATKHRTKMLGGLAAVF